MTTSDKRSSMLRFAASLLFLSVSGWASEPAHYSVEPRPEPMFTSLYVGHYGESFAFKKIWNLRTPVLVDGIEVVRFSYVPISRLPRPNDRPIEDADYSRPENFSALRLAQLLVIPQNGRGYADLSSLRAAKQKDLAEKGFLFRIEGAPMPQDSWPADTFTVFIDKPYHLIQLYTQSEGRLFILTGGEPARDFISLIRSLGDYFERSEESRSYEPMQVERVRRISAPLFVMGMLLLLWPWAKNMSRPLAFAALLSAAGSTGLGVIGFYVAGWLLSVNARGLILSGAISWMIVAALLAAIIARGRHLSIARKWCVGIPTILSTVLLAIIIPGFVSTGNANRHVANDFSLLLWIVGLLYGACLGMS